MTDITINTSGTQFLESAGNNGTIANQITVRLTGGTFAGNNGDVVAGVAYTGVPAGLSAALVKTSGTTAKLSLTGAATNHANANDVTALKLTLTSASVAIGTLGASSVEKTFTVDFRDAAQVGTLAMVAPTVAFGKTLPVLQGAATSTTSKVFIFNGTKQLGEAKVDASTGLWTFTPPTVKDGVFQLTAQEQFAEKVFGTPTGVVPFTVDTKAPAAPTVNAIKLPTSDAMPTLSGKAEKGTLVEVSAGGVSLGTTVADTKTGAWTLTVPNAKMLADGVHQITATATDAAGNTSTSKKTVTLTVDTAIEVPTITTTLSAVDKLVTQKLEGTAEAGATLQLYGGPDGITALGNPIKVDKYGQWKATVKLTEGTHVLSAVATDMAGNSSANSTEKTITIDTIAPDAPTLVVPETLKLKAVPATLTGTAEPGLMVWIYANSTKLGEVKADDSTGVWTFSTQDITPLKEGKQQLSVKATDAAGNLSKPSNVVTLTIDPNAPTFEVAVATNELTFSGPATGNITVTTAVVDGNTIATFQRDGVTATTKPDLATVNTINLAAGQTLAAAIGDAVASKAFAGAGSVNITGTAGADTLSFGTSGGNTLNGGAGDDTITGGAGNDTLTGGVGADTLDGGAGDDTFVYAALADFVAGGAVVDLVTGGDGTDKIQVNAAIILVTSDDLARVGTVEQLVAQTQSAAARTHNIAQDTDAKLGSIRTIDLSGDGHASSTGTINLTGITSAIATTLTGVAKGKNAITGGAGNDTITGGSTTDTLIGGDGADVITGGAGNDILSGGAGADTFVFADKAANNGADTITDFTFGAGGDKLNFDAFLTTAAAFYDKVTPSITTLSDAVAATSTSATPLFSIKNQVVLLTTANISTQAVDEATLFGTNRAFAAEGSPIDAMNFVLLVGETTGTNGVGVYYVIDGTEANDLTITLVGTLSNVSLQYVHANNLA